MSDWELENALAELQECFGDMDEDSPRLVPDENHLDFLDMDLNNILPDFQTFEPSLPQTLGVQEDVHSVQPVIDYLNYSKEVKKEEPVQGSGVIGAACFATQSSQGLDSCFGKEMSCINLALGAGIQGRDQKLKAGGIANPFGPVNGVKINPGGHLIDSLSPSLIDLSPSEAFGKLCNQENLPCTLQGLMNSEMNAAGAGINVTHPVGVMTATLSDSNSSSGRFATHTRNSKRTGGALGLSEKSLEELKDMDPKRAKRIVSNRESAARSKERKLKHIHFLEQESTAQQARSRMLHVHLEQCLKINMGLQQENSCMRQSVSTAKQKLDDATVLRESLQRQMANARTDTAGEYSQTPCSSHGWPIRRLSTEYNTHWDQWNKPSANQLLAMGTANCIPGALSSTHDPRIFQKCSSDQSYGTLESSGSDFCGKADFALPIPFMSVLDEEMRFDVCDDNWSALETDSFSVM